MDYHAIGIMSGSSLDGLDICLTRYTSIEKWTFEILASETVDIPEELAAQLRRSAAMGALELLELDVAYGRWIGDLLKEWISKKDHPVEVIGIHGHTVYHEPGKGVSLQIGSGGVISQRTGIRTVDGFRSKDVQAGGQGAPLVPFGEHYLFPGYQAFLNLGGIANISFHSKRITAWDIAPCNQIFNQFALKLGSPFDEGGQWAREGLIDEFWLSHLQSLAYFQLPPPKSLSNQWSANVSTGAPQDPKEALHTYSRFLAALIAKVLGEWPGNCKVLVTGGGAYNTYLLECLRELAPRHCEIEVPSRQIVDFKEALVFGFMAVQRMLGKPNIFSSVTGAQHDTVSGVLHLPR